MKTKSCTHKGHKGQRELPLSAFSKHPKTKSGRQSICKECNKRLVYKHAAEKVRERRRLRGQEPLELYKKAVKQMVYKEPPLDYREEITADILLRDL